MTRHRIRRCISALVLAASACAGHGSSNNPPPPDSGTDGGSDQPPVCSDAPLAWSSMPTYVLPAGTGTFPRFERSIADAVWSGHEMFVLGTVHYTTGCQTAF